MSLYNLESSRQVNMIVELDHLERLLPNSQSQLRLLSKTIRNSIWEKSDELMLAAHLYACNRIFAIIKENIEESTILYSYIEFLKMVSYRYSAENLNDIYDRLLKEEREMCQKAIISRQWRRINPYCAAEFSDENEGNKKNIIQILDDFYNIISEKEYKEFLIPLGDFETRKITRGRRKKWLSKKDLAAPSMEVAKKNKIVNRWNPPDKRFLYLAVGDAKGAEETAIEEMRAKSGEEVTLGDFEIRNEAKKRLIVNFDYETVSKSEINSRMESDKERRIKRIVQKWEKAGRNPSEEELREDINSQKAEIREAVEVFIGQVLMKELCDEIFVPLDTDEEVDSEKKDKCYKSFHILASYFESKGYAGIVYPSTRMKLKGKTGTNLVLFDADSAEAKEETMRTISA